MSVLDSNNILLKFKNQTGIILYIEYIKGDETSLVISHSVKSTGDPNETIFYNIIDRASDSTLSNFYSTLADSANIVYPIALTLSNNKVKVNFDFVGATAPGIINVYCKLDDTYYN
jgi:hypothetical protein